MTKPKRFIDKVDRVLVFAIRFFDMYPERLRDLKLLASFCAGGLLTVFGFLALPCILKYMIGQPAAGVIMLAILAVVFIILVLSDDIPDEPQA